MTVWLITSYVTQKSLSVNYRADNWPEDFTKGGDVAFKRNHLGLPAVTSSYTVVAFQKGRNSSEYTTRIGSPF